MKTIFSFILLTLLVTLTGCKQKTQHKSPLKAKVVSTSFYIDAIAGDSINYNQIAKSLKSLQGITNIQLEPKKQKATVYYYKNQLTLENIATAVTTLNKGHTYKVYNMTE